MKVWNQEITACWMCPYYDFPIGEDDIGYMCTADEHMIEDGFKNNQIHKDCPFNKTINKKIVEELGFNKEKTSPSINIYTKNEFKVWEMDNLYTIYNYKSTEIFISKLFLNNPEELKLILKNLKIIE